MSKRDVETKLAELDRLLNDPEVRLDPARVWSLLAEISAQDLGEPGFTPTATPSVLATAVHGATGGG